MSDSKLWKQTQTLAVDPRSRGSVAGRRPILIVVQGEGLGRRHPLGEQSIVIGRDEALSDVVIDDPSVSSRHARVQLEPGGGNCVLTDLASRNGTYVNGSPVSRHVLREGDKIWLGGTVLKFTLHDSIEDRFHGELDRRMHIDSLSGLYMRGVFDHQYPKAFERARASGTAFCVVMLDMDGLKRVNDTCGHQAGSRCIGEAGAVIKRCLPGGGSGSRFGGDEFVLWLPDLTLEDALSLGELIRARIEECPFALPLDQVPAPTISVGVATLSPDVRAPEDLLKIADDALYRAKKAGGNIVCV